MNWLILAALAPAAGAALLSSLGVLLARDCFERLHFPGPAAVIGCPFLLLAVWLEEGFSSFTVRVALIMLVLLTAAPLLTHATARAALARGDARRLRNEDWEPRE